MSNLLLNWRLGSWHIQVQRENWFYALRYGMLPVRFEHNPVHVDKKMTWHKLFDAKAWKVWFERY